MPILAGAITPHGAVIDCLVGVCEQRQKLLTKHGFAVPPPVPVRVLIDTGASVSACSGGVFLSLDLKPLDRIDILTPSTRPDSPHPTDLFQVSWSLVADGRTYLIAPTLQVIASEDFHPSEGVTALIGRDLLTQCAFQYWGPDGRFHLSF